MATERIEHRHLRAAIELAIAEADAGARQRPPLGYPAALRPYLRTPRVPTAALGRLRRAVESDEAFRRRVADAAGDRVDGVALEWLRHEAGWQERARALADDLDEAADASRSASALRRADRRRQAAEEAALRAQADVDAMRSRLEAVNRERAEDVALQRRSEQRLVELAEQLRTARQAERHANDRAEAAQRRLDAAHAERDAARAAADEVSAQRDALLAERAERSGGSVSATQVTELRALAESARRLADRLGDVVATGPAARAPLAVPGGVGADSRRAAEHLLRAGGVVVVDGYNVAKLAWPEEALVDQRRRALDLVDDVARRVGSEIVVVFDGAEVVGAHASTRRLARVVYSPAGTSADDVIRSVVAGTPEQRAVVVVTSDRQLRRSVVAMGANVVTSAAFLDAMRR